jgi:hypothetical protein
LRRDISNFKCTRGSGKTQSVFDSAGRAAVPSAYDLDHAWPVYSYIVVAVTAGRAEDLLSWEMQPDRSRFNEEEIVNVIDERK